jgi:hypothetical protein
MAISRPEAIDDAAFTPAAKRRTAARRLSCLARNAGSGVPGRLVAWGGPVGEESCRTPLRQRRSRRCRPSARSSQERTRGTQPPDRPGDDLGHTPPIRAHPPLPCNKAPQREGRSRRIRSDPSSRCLRLGNEALARPDRASTSPAFLGQARPLLACCSLRPGPGERDTMLRSGSRRRPSLRLLRPEWAFSSARLVRQGSSPKGPNGEAGSSAADEPGPQGDARLVQPCTAGGKTPKDTRRTAYGPLGWEFNGWIAPTTWRLARLQTFGTAPISAVQALAVGAGELPFVHVSFGCREPVTRTAAGGGEQSGSFPADRAASCRSSLMLTASIRAGDRQTCEAHSRPYRS